MGPIVTATVRGVHCAAKAVLEEGNLWRGQWAADGASGETAGRYRDPALAARHALAEAGFHIQFGPGRRALFEKVGSGK